MFSGLASNRTCLAAFVCGRVVIEWSAGIVAMTNDPGDKRSRGAALLEPVANKYFRAQRNKIR